MSNTNKVLSSLTLFAICAGCALKDTNRSSPSLADSKGDGSRNMYSPDIYGDAYAQQQWAAEIEALEAQCRTTGQYCLEAERARQALRKDTGGLAQPAR